MRWYTCHKRVQAAQIIQIDEYHVVEGSPRIAHIHLDGGEAILVNGGEGLAARYFPQVGDYVVKYDDGYTSISPKKAFEEGYAVDPDQLPPGAG